MPHPLVLQLRIAPTEFVRGLDGITDALVGIQLGGVAGQALQSEARRGARGEEVLHARAVGSPQRFYAPTA
jgi:hypothetical protein